MATPDIATSRSRNTRKKKPLAVKKKGFTVAKTLPKSSATKSAKAKNVTNVQQLKNGSTLTSLKGGRKIQQVKGKSAYVVAKGKGKPRTRLTAAQKAAKKK